MKRFVLLLILAILLLAPAIAHAQKVITLEPTRYGLTLNANGEASLEFLPREGMKSMQVFTLAVHSDVANREALSIEVVTKSGVFQIGELRMLLSMGTMEKWNTIEPSPIFPLEEVLSITIRQGKRAVLVGHF